VSIVEITGSTPRKIPESLHRRSVDTVGITRSTPLGKSHVPSIPRYLDNCRFTASVLGHVREVYALVLCNS
jgi:hypothetical protein